MGILELFQHLVNGGKHGKVTTPGAPSRVICGERFLVSFSSAPMGAGVTSLLGAAVVSRVVLGMKGMNKRWLF